MATVPDYLRRVVVEGEYAEDRQPYVQNELLLALVDAVDRQTEQVERVAETFSELAKLD